MVRLAGSLRRRRWWIVAAWLAIVVVSLPMAAKQTEHLSGGGFDVPGSQSRIVETAATQRFTGTRRGRLALVFEPAPGATPEQSAAAVDAVGKEVGADSDASLTPEAAAAAKAQLAAGKVAIAPLEASGDSDDLVNTAGDI